MVRIRGERPILSNKRSRFNQEITVPEMCDLNKIHSKFQNGILTIIIPKDVPPKLLTPEEVSKTIQKTTPTITSKATADQPTKQTERQKVDQKTTSDQTKVHMGKENETVQNAKIEPKSKKAEDRDPLKQEIPSTSKAPELPKLQKVQDNSVSTKPMLIKVGADKQKDEKSAIVSSIAQKPSADQLKIQTAGREEADQKGMTEPNSQKVDEKKLRKVKEKAVEKNLFNEKEREDQRVKESSISADHEKVVPKIKEDKETITKKIDGFTVEKPKEEYDITKFMMGIENVKGSAKEAVKNVLKGVNNEERQLLVNVLAAVLVLVGFGAYVSYSFG